MACHTRPSVSPIRIARHLVTHAFGLRLGSDLHELAAETAISIPLSRRRASRLDCIRQAGILFIHVPKNGGMSICEALYGRQLKHGSARYYRHVAPQLAHLPSFAVIRDPIDRFVSAYRYAIGGGSDENSIAPEFQSLYSAFRSLDDALDHVEAAATPYAIDHIFRPQSWYVTANTGQIAVDDLFLLGDRAVSQFVRHHNGKTVSVLNESTVAVPEVSLAQRDRVKRLYGKDMVLYALAQSQSEHRIKYGTAASGIGE
jgi:hypothetical protein